MDYSYTQEQIDQLRIKKYECGAKKECHKRASMAFDYYDKVTGIPQIVLSAIVSSLTVSTLDSQSTGSNYTVASCSSVLAILASLSRFFEFGKMKESHKKTSFAYGKLERTIDLEMARTNKKPFDELFENVINDYNNIRENSHLIPTYIERLYPYRHSLKCEIDNETQSKEIIIQ